MASGAPAAILAAGGRGERSGSALPKQFRNLAGRPLLMWSLETLARGGCEPLIVVVPADHVNEAHDLVGEDALVTAGGTTRQESVYNGLRDVTRERVVVHDAARPLATSELVRAVVAALSRGDGAVAALPIDETLKRVEDERVEATIDRSGLWATQTPQAFGTEILRAAHERARAGGIDGTDDAQLVEQYGGTIVVVEGARSNFKITWPGDFELAEALVRA